MWPTQFPRLFCLRRAPAVISLIDATSFNIAKLVHMTSLWYFKKFAHHERLRIRVFALELPIPASPERLIWFHCSLRQFDFAAFACRNDVITVGNSLKENPWFNGAELREINLNNLSLLMVRMPLSCANLRVFLFKLPRAKVFKSVPFDFRKQIERPDDERVAWPERLWAIRSKRTILGFVLMTICANENQLHLARFAATMRSRSKNLGYECWFTWARKIRTLFKTSHIPSTNPVLPRVR